MPERVISPKQFEAVLKLDGPVRYDHFIKQVVDWEQAWGLYDDGWSMGADDDGTPTLQLWPASEYARAFAAAEWASFVPQAIPLDDLIEDLLPAMASEGVVPSVFPTPAGQSVMPSVEQLLADLKNELTRYE